jgi:hypothetical protein
MQAMHIQIRAQVVVDRLRAEPANDLTTRRLP